jgi:uncharacterized protein (TIGR03435 family)
LRARRIGGKKSAKVKEWQEGPKDPALPLLTQQESNGLRRDESGVTHMPEGRSGMAFSGATGPGHLEAVQVTMGTFATWLSATSLCPGRRQDWPDRKIQLRDSEFNPGGRGTAPRTAAEEASEPTADLFAVLQGQLGLKLERKETPRNALVIDRIQKTPVEN